MSSFTPSPIARTPQGTAERLVDQASPGAMAIAKPFAAAVLRHVATAAGAYLVTKGITDSSGATGFVGAVMTIGGLGWSWFEKYGRAQLGQALQDAAALLHARADAAAAGQRKPAPVPPIGGSDPRQNSTGG